jgi:serine/threonine protein kinase
VHGISQNPHTKEYIIVFQYAKGGNFNDWIRKNYKNFTWVNKLKTLSFIIDGLEAIHQEQLVHRDFHPGNILFKFHKRDHDASNLCNVCISDMGLCGEIGNTDKTKIYGVLPYVAPEVLYEKPYTQAADIYSFGMIMYFVATGIQPFANNAFNSRDLALSICIGARPEINDLKAPKCYVDLMKRCWDSNPGNRPKVTEIKELILLFQDACGQQYEFQKQPYREIENQFREAEKYRRLQLSSIEESKQSTNHQSQLLNPHIKDLPKCEGYHDNKSNESGDDMLVDDNFNEFSDPLAMEQLLFQNLQDSEFDDGDVIETEQ